MIKINKKVIILLTISLALIYVLIFYVNLANQDKYFPYWDPYDLKDQAESLNDTYFSNVSDPLVFYNFKILKEISGVSYYSLIKYASLFFIVVLFLAIILFMKEIFIEKKKNLKILPVLGVLYFFFFFYTYLRFSMTLRENLVMGIALLFIFFLLKLEKNNKISVGGGILFISLFLSYLLGAHILIFMIFGGVTFFYLFYLYIKKDLSKGKFIFILLLFILLAFPFIYQEFFGILNQIIHGEELITRTGFTVAYNFIKLEYFLPLFDLMIIFFGTTFILKRHNKINPKIKVILLIFLFILCLGFFGSYISSLGVKQNRFTIYIYLFLSVMLMFAFSYIKKLNLKFIMILLVMFLIVFSPLRGIIDYQTYKPINEEKINYLVSNAYLVQDYPKVYCGKSAKTVFQFFETDLVCIDFDRNIENIPFQLDKPIILLKDDYDIYKLRLTQYIDKIELYRIKENEIFDEKTKTLIILPKNDNEK